MTTDHGYPAATRLDLRERLPVGDPVLEVADPYRWLEDEDSPESVAWLAEQETLYQAFRDRWPTREHFAHRVRQLLDSGYTGPPIHRGQRVFFSQRQPGDEHGRLLVTDDGDPANARVLLDPMQLDPSGATTLDAYQPSKDGRLLAYQISTGGTEDSTLRVLDVATGEIVDGPIDRTRYSPVAWLRDQDAFYYVRRLAPDLVPDDERQYHRRVYLHRVGSPAADDAEIFGAGRLKTSYYGVGVSWDGRWLTVSAAEGTDPRNDVWLADLQAGPLTAPQLKPVITGEDARTSVAVGRDGRLYVSTDLGAPRGRLAVTDPTDPGPATWRDLIPERPDAVLDDYLVLDDGNRPAAQVLVSWTRHAVSELSVHTATDGTIVRRVELPGLGTLGALIGRPEGGTEAWFSYTDYVTPPRVLRLTSQPSSQPTVHALPPGSVDVPAVSARQIEFASADGTTVRAFVLARTDLLDETAEGAPLAPAPTVLYGYGGFSNAMSPGYSASMLAWVEAGGVYAIAGLRGGSEEGEEWHRAGMLAHKQNVFDDFHAAAQALLDGGWTTPTRLGIQGGSNGGLLVGAALTQWPELFKAVVCSAPLLDMVRYQLHGLGVSWTGEYGDANRPDDLRWLHAYSPYHRVVDGTAYPATLFTLFAGDTRVAPLHGYKLAAALQHATARSLAEAPILLRRELNVGHGGRSVSKSVGLTADVLGFLAAELDLDVPAGEAP